MSDEVTATSPASLDLIGGARRTLEGVIGVPATEGNRVTVLHNGCEIFPAMLSAIRGAEHTIDFLTFVYWKGEIGVEMAEALGARAKAGVRVRVLLDAWGSRPIESHLIDEMKKAGVQLRWFRPLGRVRPGEVNHRTHRKVLVVDESVAFTGGVGISDLWKGDRATNTSGATPTSKSRDRSSTGCARPSWTIGPRLTRPSLTLRATDFHVNPCPVRASSSVYAVLQRWAGAIWRVSFGPSCN